MGYNPTDVEIRYIARDQIYDLYVGGAFKNFFRTFGEAVKAAEELQAEKKTAIADPVGAFRALPKRGGKLR